MGLVAGKAGQVPVPGPSLGPGLQHALHAAALISTDPQLGPCLFGCQATQAEGGIVLTVGQGDVFTTGFDVGSWFCVHNLRLHGTQDERQAIFCIFYTVNLGYVGPTMDQPHQRLRQARLARGFDTAAAAADHHGWNRNTYASNENGNAAFSWRRAQTYAQAFGVGVDWLVQPGPAPQGQPTVPVLGRVGANPEGRVLLASGQPPPDRAPIPPGGSGLSVCLEVSGHSMRGLADDGALIYFEDQRTPPTPDMLGQVVVVETQDGEILVKRLLRGSTRAVFDLESMAGPTRHDTRLKWAAHITAIIPPVHARRIILRADEQPEFTLPTPLRY